MKKTTLAIIRCIVPILMVILVIFQGHAQCSPSEVQLEIIYSTFTSTIEGDAIRLKNSSSTEILHCQEFGTGDFTDTICIEENTQIEVYGNNRVDFDYQTDLSLLDTDKIKCPALPSSIMSSIISGDVKTYKGIPIENVTITAESDAPQYPIFVLTDSTGGYNFVDNPDELSYQLLATYDEDCTCGLNTLDLLLVIRRIIGLSNLDAPYGIIAADVNSDFQISTIDAIQIKQMILGIITEFPNNDCWEFVNESQIFIDDFNPFPFEEEIVIDNLDGDVQDQNFVAVKIGDVDGSCVPNVQPEYIGEILLEADNQALATGDTVEVEIYSSEFLDVYGMQFSLSHEGLELVEVISGDVMIQSSDYYVSSQGETTTFSWVSASNPVSSNGVILKLVFEAIEDLNLIDVLQINTDIVAAEAYTTFDFALNSFSLNSLSLIINSDTCSNTLLDLDGQNDRIVITNQYTGNVDFSIECLFLSENEVDNGTSSFHRIFTLGTGTRMELGDQLGRLIYFDGSFLPIGPNIRDGEWHHVAIVRELNTVKVYLDGVEIMNKDVETVDLSNLRIGFFDNNNLEPVTMWKGGIDEIKLWNYALSQEEIETSMFASNLNKQECGLIGYWAFENGVANGNNSGVSEVLDSTENNNGILFGFELQGETSNFICHDSIEIAYDPAGCCQIAIFHSTQCNIINLNSAPIDFEDETQVTYSWTSPNTNFEGTVVDTIWAYQGDLSEVIICLEATDGNCMATTCDTIAVSQPQAPTLEGCADEFSLPYQEDCSVSFDFATPVGFDPCTNAEIEVFCSRSDGLELTDPYPLGTTIVECIATGVTGLMDTCITMITVVDEIPPECAPIPAIFILDESGVDSLQLGDLNPPGNDECGETFFLNPEQVIYADCFPVAGMTVDLVDESGNVSQCLLNYEILDSISPKCIVGDQTVAAIGGQDSTQVFYEYEIEDNCPNPTVTFSIPDGSNFACGSEQEIFMYVEDNFGNTDTCNFTIFIEDCFDYFGSVCGSIFEDLNCNGFVDAEEGGLAGINIGLYNPVDNDLLASAVTDISGNYKVDTFPAISFVVRPFNIDEIYEVLAPAEDEYLAEIDTFETIENLDFVLSYDGPTTAIPLEEVCYQAGDTVFLEWKPNPCLNSANVLLFESVCGNEMFSQLQIDISNTGSYQYIIPNNASNQIIELALIGPGNTEFERFNCFEINDFEIDFSFELIGCREYQFTATPGTYLGYQWTFGDNQGFMGLDNLSHIYSENGVYEVCLQVRTELGCETEICKELTIDGECDDCNVTFEVNDLECYDVGFSVNEENYELTPNYQWTIDGEFETEEREPFFDLGPGTFEICLTSSDGICSDSFCRTITRDTIFPELLNCIQGPVEIPINENCDNVFYTPAVMEGFYCHPGDANTPDVVYSRSDGASFNAPYPMGTTTLTASFTDLYGVSSSCSFDIVVADDIPPVCQVNSPVNFQLDQNGQLTIDPSMIDNGSFDNCSEVEISIEQSEFDCSNIGQFNMTFTASDGINISTCTVQVSIEDGLAPFCSIETTEVFVDENGNIPLQLEDLSYIAEDNCGIADIELLGTDIPCNETGPNGTEHEITMLVTDDNGLSSQCNTTILLRDTIAPECIDLEVFFEVTQIGQIATPFVDPNLFFDNCNIIGTIIINPEAICENIGSQLVDVKVNDSGGNQTICPVTFTYLDRIPPTCDIADLDIQATEENGAFVTFDGFAEDPCNDEIDISYSMENGALYECGEYTITMTATDEHGNSSSCDFSLNVRDCDGCCLSETAFMNLTNQGFSSEAMLDNQGNCEVQIYPPTLTDCQIISQIVWGDGTIMNGQFPSYIDFIHEYNDAGLYEVCITIEETDSGDCFSNQVCEDIEITSECQVITSIAEQLSIRDVTLYPNPTTSILNISYNINLDEVELFDLNGTQLILESKTQIDMSLFPEGIYLLRLTKGNDFITKKIIKL